VKAGNLFDRLPADLRTEAFDEILRAPGLRIERIVSRGHTSPETGWYDQDEHEWVLVLQGSGTVSFEDGTSRRLSPGDHLHIPAHCRHRVSWTDPDAVTVWLAVFHR
jgi:cupin 2 domain-containing protein